MCGWKDRCRVGNLRTYCHVSPILFGCFLWKPALHVFEFCEMLFLELVSGDFLGGRGLFGDSIPTCLHLQIVSVVFRGVREII